MAANEKLIKKFKEKADKELKRRDDLQKEYENSLCDRSRGVISRRELNDVIEPLFKKLGKQKKRSMNAEKNRSKVTNK